MQDDLADMEAAAASQAGADRPAPTEAQAAAAAADDLAAATGDYHCLYWIYTLLSRPHDIA